MRQCALRRTPLDRADLPPGIVPSPNVRMWDTEGGPVAGKRYTAEQIIGHLRQAEIRISEGKTVAEVVRELGVSAVSYTHLTLPTNREV